jgi:hypothetical protein
MAETRYIFICKDPALDTKAARDFLAATAGIDIVHTSGTDASFLAKADTPVAEAFKAANLNWNVYPEVRYPLPRTRFSIKPQK